MSKVIDSFFVALGFKVDPKSMTDVQRKVMDARQSILSLGTAMRFTLAGAGVGGLLAGAVSIGNQWEQNKIQIAGFLNALGVSSDFNAGLEEASRVMEKITADAARLPGEAEEYIDVFKTAFPVIKESMKGATVDQMVDFSNKMAAYGKSQNLDSGTTGRETQMLLAAHGRAGAHNVLWQRIQALLPKGPGGNSLDPKEFNALSQEKRMELLQGALLKLDPMLQASAKSFDAMWGAAKSAFRKIIRLATEGLFGQVKVALDKLNAKFFNADGTITEFGQHVVDDLKAVVRAGIRFAEAFIGIVSWLSKFKAAAIAAKIAALALIVTLVGPVVLVGAAIALVAEDIWTFFNNGDSLTGLIVNKLKPALTALKLAVILLGSVMVGPTILAGIRTLMSAVRVFALFHALQGPKANIFMSFLKASGQMIVMAGRTVAAWVAAAARIAIAWAVANAPLALTILAIAAIATAIYLLWDNWDEVVGWMKKKWEDFVASLKSLPTDIKHAVGFGTAEEGTEGRSRVGGWLKTLQHVVAPSTILTDTIGEAIANRNRTPAASMSGSAAVSGGNATTVNNETNISVSKIEVQSTDPKGAADEVVRRLDREKNRATIRDGQSKVF